MKIELLSADTYISRRRQLTETVKSGKILFLGNQYSPMNYKDNYYDFRQDACFLYYFGLNLAGLNAIIDIDNDETILFGDELSMDDIVWTGPLPSIASLAAQVGVENTRPSSELQNHVDQNIHFLPPYRARHRLHLAELTGMSQDQIIQSHSSALINAIIQQRNIKTAEEIKEMDLASSITSNMHRHVMINAKPNLSEHDLVGYAKFALAHYDSSLSFPPILTRNGHILHNHSHDNEIFEGDLILFDGGCTSPLQYAGDMTRTFPANGRFNEQQKIIYNIVLQAQESAIEMLKPGVKYFDAHKKASLVIAEGLKAIGIMKGDSEEAVQQGAHALFFQHGLGHMIGLDVHDMENLGETLVGYENDQERSTQFGLKSLRLARTLEVGHAVTVEPGIYFIPLLIEKWQAENKFSEFINYNELLNFIDFGGIRIEDDVIVTDNSRRILGTPLAKSITEIEELMGQQA